MLLPFEPGDSALKIKVSAPPEDGKANAAVVKLLADILMVSKSRIEILSGEQSRHKQVGIAGAQEVDAFLEILGKAMQTLESECFEMH